MGKGGGSETTQTQTVQQSTTVTVQNIIDNSKVLDPLEKLKLLADVFATLDASDTAKKNAGTPGAVVSIANIPAASMFSNPATLSLLIGGAVLAIYLFRKK
jgi:hypothetical protein